MALFHRAGIPTPGLVITRSGRVLLYCCRSQVCVSTCLIPKWIRGDYQLWSRAASSTQEENVLNELLLVNWWITLLLPVLLARFRSNTFWIRSNYPGVPFTSGFWKLIYECVVHEHPGYDQVFGVSWFCVAHVNISSCRLEESHR